MRFPKVSMTMSMWNGKECRRHCPKILLAWDGRGHPKMGDFIYFFLPEFANYLCLTYFHNTVSTFTGHHFFLQDIGVSEMPGRQCTLKMNHIPIEVTVPSCAFVLQSMHTLP